VSNLIWFIVEGQTERGFVDQVLREHLSGTGLSVHPSLFGKSGKQGGVPPWRKARKDILSVLKGGRYCTTMLDYYGMPCDWPGRADAASRPFSERAQCVEDAVMEDITKELGTSFNPAQFIPYVQMHEYEALLFSDVSELAAHLADVEEQTSSSAFEDRLREVLKDRGEPEAINDNHDTCPSRRIMRMAGKYGKVAGGLTVAKRIGIPTMRSECPHFAEWIGKLEKLRA
jgi:uncharacterized protein DUF4276